MLKSLIIGCGAISHVHVNSIKENGGKILAVCDIKEERATALAKEAGCDKTYTDYKVMLTENKDADVVHVCTPHYLHFEMIEKCLKARKEVVTEKPVTMKAEEFWDRIRKKVAENG